MPAKTEQEMDMTPQDYDQFGSVQQIYEYQEPDWDSLLRFRDLDLISL